eukprot:747937-Prymnesium_polylepis.2
MYNCAVCRQICDNGIFPTDDGSYPDWNCPAYGCDQNACDSCGLDPPAGVCGSAYQCQHGACGPEGTCVCNQGYFGFTCDEGHGVCPDQFSCSVTFSDQNTCVNGRCSCYNSTGHACEVCGGNCLISFSDSHQPSQECTYLCDNNPTAAYCAQMALQTNLAEVEVRALADLFYHTGGNAWHIKTGWFNVSDPCDGNWAQGT